MLTPNPQMDEIRQKTNPVEPGRKGLAVLRELSRCPLPSEAEALKKMMEQTLASNIELTEDLADTMGKGLAAITLADSLCQRHTRKRVAANFKDNEATLKLHEECRSLHTAILRVHHDLMQMAHDVQAKLKQRWETSVKTFGLALEKYSYQIDEESGTIYLVELDCDKCEGRVKAQQARQAISEKLVSFERTGTNETREPGENRA
jgi:hypothetical protein